MTLPERQGHHTRPLGWTPIGGDLVLCALINDLGETNSLFQRDIFWDVGGFQGGLHATLVDFDLLIRALIKGHRIDVLPEILMLYRRSPQSRSMGPYIFPGHLNSLQKLAELMPEALRPLLLPLRCEWYARHRGRRDNPTG